MVIAKEIRVALEEGVSLEITWGVLFWLQESNNMAEAKPLLHGIKLCISKGIFKVIVESGSQLFINMINYKMKAHWHIKHIIDQIVHLSSSGNFVFVHIHREGNMDAD